MEHKDNRFPPMALIWLYHGKNAQTRYERIAGLHYPGLHVIEVREGFGWARAARAIPKEAEICVFWIDDGKPVGEDFLEKMVLPVTGPKDTRAVMHFWSGNAVSLDKKMLDCSVLDDDCAPAQSLLQLLLPVLDMNGEAPRSRVHLAFSSTERLAPLCMEPVGLTS
jgi:hypothetical protein